MNIKKKKRKNFPVGAKQMVLMTALCLCAFILFACKGAEEPAKDGKYRVFCTVFPVYDWLENVTADTTNIELVLLDTHGADLHSYQPTVSDMLSLAESDLVVYVGGESDKWVSDAVKNAGTDVKGLSLLDLLGDRVKAEETVEGMKTHTHESHEQETDEPENDEHVWLSVKNAAFLTEKLTAYLCAADRNDAKVLQDAAEMYAARLEALDEAFGQTVKAARLSFFLVADRFPFRYLADDYGLTYYAAFPGCSAESDAGFDTVIFLADKVDEYGLTHIAVTESTDGAVAHAVLENAEKKDVSVVTLDSMQSVSKADRENGKNYISVMEENLAALGALLS